MQSLASVNSRGNSMSGTSTPKGGVTQNLDIYRPLANQITPLLSTPIPTTITDLLSLRPTAYTQKVQNKTLTFASAIQDNRDESKAVRGKKRNRGDPNARESARRAAIEERERREKLDVDSRKKRKRAVMDAGQEMSYETIRPLHHLHTIYLTNVLNLPPHPGFENLSTIHPNGLATSTDSLHSRISKTDFTGARLKVICARNPSLNGINGFVIEETASTFRLVTPKSVIKVIPKNGTQFEITFPACGPPASPTRESDDEAYQSTVIPISSSVMEEYIRTTPRIAIPLLGTNFGFRSGDRAGRKFRPTQGGGGGSGWGEEWVKGEWSELLGTLEDPEEAEVEGNQRKSGKLVSRQSGVPIKRKRNKSRRKDPPAFGALEVS